MPKPKRILIVDDESTLVFFLKQGLQAEGTIRCQVEACASGEEALTRLTNSPYHLLITDLKMSGISGLKLVEAARARQPDIKIILMTAYGSDKVQAEAKRLGVNAYLTKPFSITKLQKTVNQILTAETQASQVSAVEREYPSAFQNPIQKG